MDFDLANLFKYFQYMLIQKDYAGLKIDFLNSLTRIILLTHF